MGENGADLSAPVLQAPDQLKAFVGGNAARNDQKDALAVQHGCLEFVRLARGSYVIPPCACEKAGNVAKILGAVRMQLVRMALACWAVE